MNKNFKLILIILFLTIFTGCSSLDVETVDTSTSTTSTQIETTTSTIISTTTSSTTTTTTIFSKSIENIEDAQSKLKELNLYNGDINGLNNSETKNAIREFQRLSGLVVDGILGPITKAALEKGEASYIAIGEGDVDTVETIVYSAEIEDAQKKLKELNLYTKNIDGINGIGTKNAIREFQRLSGLVVDGILGPITKAALEKGEA